MYTTRSLRFSPARNLQGLMSFFNNAQRDGLLTGRYICSECGGLMEFEDEWEDTLVCPACGHSVDLEHYGMENDEEYDALYPTREQICDD